MIYEDNTKKNAVADDDTSVRCDSAPEDHLEEYLEILKHGETGQRMILADDPGTPDSIVDRLACDESPYVRTLVAVRENLPFDLRRKLDADPDVQILKKNLLDGE
jgi:hypothetical protein